MDQEALAQALYETYGSYDVEGWQADIRTWSDLSASEHEFWLEEAANLAGAVNQITGVEV